MNAPLGPIDPKLDLVLERNFDVPVELVWQAWTTPDSLKHWFCPRPWGVSECEMDVRPGGIFRTVMRSPEGELHPNIGCYLDVKPMERLVFTDALLPGFRPAPEKGFFTAGIFLTPTATGTYLKTIAVHATEEGCGQHEEMGFTDGWGTMFDQMIEHIKAGRN